MPVYVQSDSVALAIGVTNCLPCNQPLFACCSHQNSFECSVAMVPWKICRWDFFSLPEIAVLIFLSVYLTDEITLDQFETKLVHNIKIDCLEGGKKTYTQKIKEIMFCRAPSAEFFGIKSISNAHTNTVSIAWKLLSAGLWRLHQGPWLIWSPHPQQQQGCIIYI